MSQITKKMGYVSLFGENSLFEKENLTSNEEAYYQTGDIDFQELADLIKSKEQFKIPKYNTIVKGKQTKIGGKYATDKTKFSNYVLGKNDDKGTTFFPDKSSNPLTVENEPFFYNGYVINTFREASARISKRGAKFTFNVSIEKETYIYRVLFPFVNSKSSQLVDTYGVIIETNNYFGFETLINYIGLEVPQSFKNGIINKFNPAFTAAKNDCNVIDNLYEFAPDFVVASRTSKELWEGLVSLSECRINEETGLFSGSNENIAVLNVLSSFPNNNYLYRQFQKKPDILKTLYEEIDSPYKMDFLRIISVVCMESWTPLSVENAPTYIAKEINSYSFYNPQLLEKRRIGWCSEFYTDMETDKIKNSKNKKYGIGVTIHLYEGTPPILDFSIPFTTGFVNPTDPVKTNIKGETLYIPAIIAVYLTSIAISQTRLTLLGNLTDGFISAPLTKVAKVAATVTTAKAAAKINTRRRIIAKFKLALRRWKKRVKYRKIKNLGKSNKGLFTQIAKTKRIADDIISDSVKFFEKEIKSDSIEFGKLFDNFGNELSTLIRGTEDAIKIKFSDIINARRKIMRLGGKISDITFTHNHPYPGSSLSFEDIILAMQHNIKKYRAVNPDGSIYELTRIGNYPAQTDDLMAFIDNINKTMKNKFSNIKKGTIEYKLKKADLAIEKLGNTVEYIHYTN